MEQILSATNGRIVVGAEAVTLYSPLAESEVSRVDFQHMIEELSAKQVGLTDSSQQATTTDSSGGPLTIVSHTFSGSGSPSVSGTTTSRTRRSSLSGMRSTWTGQASSKRPSSRRSWAVRPTRSSWRPGAMSLSGRRACRGVWRMRRRWIETSSSQI